MRQCIICEYVDYSDYHPENIPLQRMSSLQSGNPSSEYKAIMTNLCDNWQSPISYLKKRGYMPTGSEDKTSVQLKKNDNENTQKSLKGKNYFFFPQNVQQSISDNLMEQEENDKTVLGAANAQQNPAATESSVDAASKNQTTGIIDKVKDKFLSIFSHKAQSGENTKIGGDLVDWDFNLDEPDYLENSNDDDVSDRRLFVRSAPEKLNLSNNDILSNLSDTDIQYIKSFINCFKLSKKNFQIQRLSEVSTTSSKPSESPTTSKSAINTTTTKSSTDSTEVKPSQTKPSEAKPSETKQNEAKSSETKPNVTKPSEAKQDKVKTSEIKPTTTVSSVDSLPECVTESNLSNVATTPKVIITSTTVQALGTTTECITEATVGLPTPKTSSGGAKGTADNFTVDLDINQKNGTGEETHLTERCSAVIVSTTSPSPPCPDKNRFNTKSKFLAHLHHMVDEVGKPPHKPLDLEKVQEIIDKSKYPSTVIMGDGKTTECAPLRLNDMSFDLEWKKIEKSPEKSREKLKAVDLPYERTNEQPGQSLAAKFLQDVNTYAKNNEKYLKTPYSDDFLDSQQTLPDNLEMPLKITTKRETVVPNSASHSHKLSKLLSDIASLPDTEGDDDYDSDDDSPESSKRRIKGRLKSRGRQKQKKFKGGASGNAPSDTQDVDVSLLDSDDFDLKKGNEFNSFEELKDIQFRVNSDDEEAISKFIANLNSPPEVFSFDVDKYLRSAQLDMEPQAPEFEFQSPEPRTYYEFLDSPAIEKERLPLIDAPSDEMEDEAVVENHARTSGGKRDLLRQYIKGVSSAIMHNYPELNEYKADEEKHERSPNLDSDITFRTNNLIDGFSSNLDAMNYIKSDDRDDFLDNFFLLNDGSSQIYDLGKQDPDIIPDDRYSPESLEIDLELNKRFRDLGIGAYNSANRLQNNAKSTDDTVEDSRRIQSRNFESVEDDQY